MENDIKKFMDRACSYSGMQREKYTESKLPSSFDFIAVPFFGDKKHEFILATTLLDYLKSKYKKYLIVCSWANHSGFFPMADEYWSIPDKVHVKNSAAGWTNTDERLRVYDRQLTRYFDVLFPETFESYYNNGFTRKFFDEFKIIKYTLPEQPSIKFNLAEQLASREGRKIFIYPVKKVNDRMKAFTCKSEFWEKLIDRLLEEKYVPVVYRDEAAYDLSAKFTDRCIFIENQKILDLFGIMRACGCVLDVFSQISRWSIAARTPFLCVTDRNIYNENRDFEIDDLFASKIPYKYIFTFATMLNGELISLIVGKLNKFLPDLDKLPHTSGVSIDVPYDVRLQNTIKIIEG